MFAAVRMVCVAMSSSEHEFYQSLGGSCASHLFVFNEFRSFSKFGDFREFQSYTEFKSFSDFGNFIKFLGSS